MIPYFFKVSLTFLPLNFMLFTFLCFRQNNDRFPITSWSWGRKCVAWGGVTRTWQRWYLLCYRYTEPRWQTSKSSAMKRRYHRYVFLLYRWACIHVGVNAAVLFGNASSLGKNFAAGPHCAELRAKEGSVAFDSSELLASHVGSVQKDTLSMSNVQIQGFKTQICACERNVSFSLTIGIFFLCEYEANPKGNCYFLCEPSEAPCSKITLYSQISWPDHDLRLANTTFQCSNSNFRVILSCFFSSDYCYNLLLL